MIETATKSEWRRGRPVCLPEWLEWTWGMGDHI